MTGAYRLLPWCGIRAPLLAVDEVPATVPRLPGTLVPADPRIRRALAVGGGDLLRALEHPPADPRARARLEGKLARYLIRMATRPTPYGLFAGAGIARWGTHTDAAIGVSAPVLRTRPDMGWLLDVVAAVERSPAARPHLRWFAHPAALRHAGRVILNEPGRAVSVQASGAVLRVLECARRPAPHGVLVAAALGTNPAAEATAPAARLVDGLVEQGLLRSDLLPALTGGSPARQVALRLAGLPESAALTTLLDQLAAWDELDGAEGAARHPELVARARALQPAPTPLQTDMALPLVGRHVHRAVAAEAARAAELLLRLSPRPRGLGRIAAYRAAFRARYGTDREVPLLEVLDADIGLGPLPAPGPALDASGRHRLLTDLAVGAIRDGRTAVELDEAMISALELAPPDVAHLPVSVDLSVFVAASSPAAIDAGDFRLVVGPNLGAQAAGRGLGRFAEVIGADAVDALREVAAAEAVADPGRVRAEVSYLPRPGRLANLVVRPLVREHQIVLDTPGKGAIRPDELVVGVRGDRFVLRHAPSGREVVPCAGHMLNPDVAPAVVRFLDGVAADGEAVLSPFDWGPAAGFPFLPRVQVGRIVLAPATWRLDPGDAAGFAAWQARWAPPRRVYLATKDLRLLLDLDDPAHVEQLRSERASVTLQEALPGPDQAWLPGPGGRHLADLVVPLVRATARSAPPDVGPVAVVPASVRTRAPGSDWLHAELHVPAALGDDVLTGPVRAFCRAAAEQFDRWFFIRYADPRPHLRIRWQGDPAALTGELAPRLLRWGGELVADGRCERFGLATYEREVERYGGPAAMAVAEELFAADSEAVLGLLAQPVERVLLGMVTIEDLLAGLGLTAPQREQLYRSRLADRRATAAEFRQRQPELRRVLGDPDRLARRPGVAELLARRRTRVAAVRARLDTLERAGELARSRLDLARSFVHMHANRLLGCGQSPEQRVLGLLLRTRESLRRAPL